MQFNQEAYDDFFYWINERHKIFLKKWRGDPKPWTEDSILSSWKFCNPFRQNDRQSKFLIDHVIKPHWNDDLGLLLFNIYAFRAFNWAPTYMYLVIQMGRNDWFDRWDPEQAKDILYSYMSEEHQKLTSGAYMIRGREGMPKYESIVQTLTDIWERKAPLAYILKNGCVTLQGAQALLINEKFWGWGSFTTYQIVLDLIYSPLLENPIDINTWCIFGPGAVRGIHEIYPELTNKMMLEAARGLLLDSPKFLERHVPTMTLQDIEFSLCESFKYERIKHGGRSKSKYNGAA